MSPTRGTRGDAAVARSALEGRIRRKERGKNEYKTSTNEIRERLPEVALEEKKGSALFVTLKRRSLQDAASVGSVVAAADVRGSA